MSLGGIALAVWAVMLLLLTTTNTRAVTATLVFAVFLVTVAMLHVLLDRDPFTGWPEVLS